MHITEKYIRLNIQLGWNITTSLCIHAVWELNEHNQSSMPYSDNNMQWIFQYEYNCVSSFTVAAWTTKEEQIVHNPQSQNIFCYK